MRFSPKKATLALSLATVLALGACGNSSSSVPEGMLSTPFVQTSDYPSALTPGELDAVVTEDRAYFLLITEFATYGLVFTDEVYGREGEPVQLVHEDGRVIASVGDRVEVGGGAYPQGEGNWSNGPEVDDFYLAIVEDGGL